MPKERYYQEENERKAMADQIEQMRMTLENQLKRIEELRSRYDHQVHQCSDLTCKLDATQKHLNQTTSMLANAEEELRQCRYTLKERDFIICEQKKAENALAQQACSLRAQLEKSLQHNASLFLKLAREDKLSADNRSVVNNFQTDLAKQLGFLSNSVATSVCRQNEHLQCVDKLCHNFLESHDKAVVDLKRKIRASRALYVSHLEDMQNVLRLHKATSTAALEEISALASSNSIFIKEFFDAEGVEANSLFDELQNTLSTH